MTLAATVLVPTHDHGPTLFHSVRSALDQTVDEVEVFIVGDGVPDECREVVAELGREDRRVRFFDNPKGPRHGEVHRHAALQEAQGEIVAYLADDDLWLPDHIATMRELLRAADFAHALPVWVAADGSMGIFPVDLAQPHFPKLLLSGENRIPFACGAHTLEMYRKLPHGWRTTPPGTHTDLYMWQQFLAHPECRAISGTRPTVLHFPSTWRDGWTVEQRLAELGQWSGKLGEPGWRERLLDTLLEGVARERALTDTYAASLNEHIRGLEVVAEERDRLLEELAKTVGERDAVRRELSTATGERDRLNADLQSIQRSRWWRLRGRLLRLPLAARLVRWVGRVRAEP